MRITEITNRIMQVLEIPRDMLADFVVMPESDNVVLYFLVGNSAEQEPKVCVGETLRGASSAQLGAANSAEIGVASKNCR